MEVAKESLQAQHIITSENLQEFQFKRLGIEIPSFTDTKVEDDKGDGDAEEVIAKAVEHEEIEEIAKEEAEEPDEIEEKPKKQGKFSKRLSELTQQRNQERQAREALEARLAALEATKPKEEIISQAQENAMPDPAKYTDQNTYNKDYQAWQQKEIQKEAQKIIQQERMQSQHRALLDDWNKKVTEFTKETPDFNENVKSVSHLAPALERNGVLPMLANDEHGVQVMDYYARNPEKAELLAKMHPIDAAIQVGKISARFDKSEDKTITKQITKSTAPVPINPIKGGKSPEDAAEGEGLDFQKYRQLRKAGKIR